MQLFENIDWNALSVSHYAGIHDAHCRLYLQRRQAVEDARGRGDEIGEAHEAAMADRHLANARMYRAEFDTSPIEEA